MKEGRIFVCGDTHGSYDIKKLSTKNWKEQKELTKDDVLIQLGDFGFIWSDPATKEELNWLNWLADKKFTTAVVLGNHENYDIIETLPWEEKWGNEVQFWEAKSGNRIYFFKRGAIYKINGKDILTIGGALSIDKHMRSEGISWWKQEDITREEIENCFNELDSHGYKVDYILTHTCPSRIVMEFIHPSMYNMGKFNDYTAKFLDEIDNLVEFDGWFFGHMHVDWKFEEYGNEYTCLYNRAPLELE